MKVYDGSDNGEKVYDTISLIGAPIAVEHGRHGGRSVDGQRADEGIAALPITITYYDPTAKDGGRTVVYSMAFELFENAVSRALVLDYNDFVIAGALGKFDIKDTKPCP